MKKTNPELTNNLPYNPLPDSFQVTPTKAEYIQALYASLHPLPPGVHDVIDGKQLSNRILQVAHVDRDHLHDRDRRAPHRGGAADREHDPALDLLAAP